MALRQWISTWTRRAPQRQPVCRGLRDTEQFRQSLDRERARSDRSGQVFCMLAFVPRGEDDQHAEQKLVELVTILQQRLRCTDEVGWLEPGRLGVILPDTPVSGAWKVVDDLLAAYPLTTEPPQCQVFVYPSGASPSKPEVAEVDEQLSDHPTTSHSPGSRGRRPGVEAAPSCQADRTCNRRVTRRMESLFALPLPWWKRTIDLLGAIGGLVLLSPLLVLVAAAVRLTSPGPALFHQRRAGLGGRPFTMYKFRSMTADAEQRKEQLLAMSEQDGPAFKLAADPRLTRLGRFLRQSSIDELPQLWNVVRGDMSLVGPRPLPCPEADACEGWQRRRLDVTPGLTCLWQVRGRSRVSFREWIQMDLEYIQRRSLWFDLRILLATVPAVLMRRGAY